jgi:two-component system, OmpR family, response regulator
MIIRSTNPVPELGASRRHSSPPPAERTRGTDEKSVPSNTELRSPAFVAPAGSEVCRGAVEQSAAPRSGSGEAGAKASASSKSPLDLAALDRTAMRILIVEDDRDAADYIARAFREVGHVADQAADGEEGLGLALEREYDVLIVDRMLPKRDGLSLIGELRKKDVNTPILILSALGQVDDRVKGLRAGGDDYLTKPYSFSELLARVEVLARRRGGRGEETVYRVGDLELDRLSHRVSRGSSDIDLQPREFRLLEYLMKHAGQVVTRTMLLENVWDYHFDPQTNVIDVHISRLRSKIDKGFSQPLLHTIRGAGYMVRDAK